MVAAYFSLEVDVINVRFLYIPLNTDIFQNCEKSCGIEIIFSVNCTEEVWKFHNNFPPF